MQSFGRTFFTGLLTVLPALATLYLGIWLVVGAEQFFGTQVKWLIPDSWYVAGMGLAVALVLVFLIGVLMHAWLFRRFMLQIEKLLLGVPVLRSVYSALKDLVGLFSAQKEDTLLQVVMLELPGTKWRVIGFVTRDDFSDLPEGIGKEGDVAVYIPMAYNLGGYTLYMQRNGLKPVEMSREDAMKFVLTAGLKGAGARKPSRKHQAGRVPA